MQQQLWNVQKRVMRMQSCSFANINQFLFAVLLSSLSLLSKNFATMVTWHHTSPLYTHCKPLLRTECHHEFWGTRAPGGRVLLMLRWVKSLLVGSEEKEILLTRKPQIPGGGGGSCSSKIYTGRLPPEAQPLNLLTTVFDRKDAPFIYPYLLLTNGTTLFTCYFRMLHPF